MTMGAQVSQQRYRAADGNELAFDIYYPPPAMMSGPAAAVILVTGYPDRGARKVFGAAFKDMSAFMSWARALAATGLVAITYENDEPADVHLLLEHLRQAAASLEIDHDRIGVWACSGHGPNALALLMEHAHAVRCAALLYPYTLDSNGSTRVADAAAQFRFVTPAAGKSVDELPRDLPLYIVRAGQDQMPGLNEALDQFVAAALARNIPLTLVNHADGQHAFDLNDDSAMTREMVRRVLAFLQFHLATP